MNLAETSDLLAFIARCDNRRADDATAIAWHSIVGDLPLGDCLAAARRHFGTSTDYLMPVHIRRLADEIDRDRRRVARVHREQLALEAEQADPTRYDRSDEVRALIEQLRDVLPDGDPDKLRRTEWIEHDRRRQREAAIGPNPHYDPQAVFVATEPGGAA